MSKYKRSISVLLAVLMLLGTFTVGALAVEEESLPFTDVASGDWFFGAVGYVYDHGIMTGIDAETFAPHAPLTRAMVVATLFRIYHGRPADADDSRSSPFNDVHSEQWFAPYVAWAYDNWIVEGISPDQFAPMAYVDRQQFAVMLYRYAWRTDRDADIVQGWQWSHFTDRDQIANWAIGGLQWANHHGIITGRTFETIVPDGTVTRAEAATMLKRFTIPPIGLEGAWTGLYAMYGDDTTKHPWGFPPFAFHVDGTEAFLYHSWNGPKLLQRVGTYQFSVAWPPLGIEGFLVYHPENELLQYTFFDPHEKMYWHHFFVRTTWIWVSFEVQLATDEVLSQFDSFYEFVESDDPELPRIVITTSQPIWNIEFSAGNFGEQSTIFHFIEELTPETPLVITGMDWGATERRGLLFRDANGWLQSGHMFQNYDGSFWMSVGG